MRILRQIALLTLFLVSLWYSEGGKASKSVSGLQIAQFLPGGHESPSVDPTAVIRSQPVVAVTKIKIRIKAGEPTDFSISGLDFSIRSFFVSTPETDVYYVCYVKDADGLFSLRGPPQV